MSDTATEDTATEIARRLSGTFAKSGFAAPSVDDLRNAAQVSLRTLYKYYPSREAMVVGALRYRHDLYLEWISGGAGEGQGHVLHIFERLGEWFGQGGTNGCLFLNALAAHPNSREVRETVAEHKSCIKTEFLRRLVRISPDRKNDDPAEVLFLIHEGQTEAAMTQDPAKATRAALRSAEILLTKEGIPA
ncbi:TetR/AcrR family transcriptional regulator [Paracoccus onubensis]|uniref:TetR/AcrR family transcriptional regulator n=1 Tax=Paracoccus onubensis TaxID=1675788 RepID=A0A418SVJ7_9RHOB|nr:TetR/AcrR family transcriptional regulator [Paracoccus onubensis]RJE84976.1 TetR/AcrR family transcriptional regulator [Paracoccus onubensis]